MRRFLVAVSLIILATALCCSQDSTSTTIHIAATVPKGWDRMNDTVWVRNDYDDEFTLWSKAIREGHMPWRRDPKNIAVTCLWSFGIHDGKPVEVFAKKLTTIKRNRIYSLRIDSAEYVVYVRTSQRIPIAEKFVIREHIGNGR